MVKTGLSIPTLLCFVAILLPLIPIIIIFLRRSWQQDIMIFLGMVCLLSCMQHLVVCLPTLASANITLINNIFGLGEFVLLLYLFKQVIPTRWIRELLHTVLISFSSVAITMYTLRGTEPYTGKLSMVAAFIILLVAIVALLQLIRDKQLFIFQSPMFWIAGGSICYFTMYFLTGFVGIQGKGGLLLQQEKLILLSVINCIRYLFFIAAAYAAHQKEENKMDY